MSGKEAEPPDSDTILFVSTYPPRECGIATFTQDLVDAIDTFTGPSVKTRVAALNNGKKYSYGNKVLFELQDNKPEEYAKLAKRVNEIESIKLVSIQHEFGIFGGKNGDHILSFLEECNKPISITFHSVIPHPSSGRKNLVRKIASSVSEIVVMTPKGIEILRKEYGITAPIKVIPHGIPDIPFEDQEAAKSKLGLRDNVVLSSFGLIGPSKGYEYVIEALPEVVKEFPNLRYVIAGETHPGIKKKYGESYREMLEGKVKELGLEDNVIFHNKYMTKKEILEFLKSSDIYVSPSLTPFQITSGTLVYAMGCGRAVVSTPFLHAEDVVNIKRGRLAGFRKPNSFSKAILSILNNPREKISLERNAYHFTRHMTWSNIARYYGKVFKKFVAMPADDTCTVPYNPLPKLYMDGIENSPLKELYTQLGMLPREIKIPDVKKSP